MTTMPKSQQVFSTRQQSQFQQLQLEVAALEKRLENLLQEQWKLTNDYNSQLPIPLIHVNEQIASTGIRLTNGQSSDTTLRIVKGV